MEIRDSRVDREAERSHADRILRLDRQQQGPDAKLCPINPDHGKMGVHRDGDKLCCTFITQRQPSLRMCNGMVPLGQSE